MIVLRRSSSLAGDWLVTCARPLWGSGFFYPRAMPVGWRGSPRWGWGCELVVALDLLVFDEWELVGGLEAGFEFVFPADDDVDALFDLGNFADEQVGLVFKDSFAHAQFAAHGRHDVAVVLLQLDEIERWRLLRWVGVDHSALLPNVVR